MLATERFLLTVHLLQPDCILPFGVPKYLLSTGSISDATKEKTDGDGVREEGNRGKEKKNDKGRKEGQRLERRKDKLIQGSRMGFCHMPPRSVGGLI